MSKIIWFILGFLITFAALIIYLQPEITSALQVLITILSGFLIGGMVGLAAWLIIGFFIGNTLPTKDVLVSSEKLCCFEDNSTYLGINVADDELKYFYAIKGDYGKQIQNISSDNCYIKKDSINPRIEKHKYKLLNKKDFWFGFCSKNDKTVIYIPDKSIKIN